MNNFNQNNRTAFLMTLVVILLFSTLALAFDKYYNPKQFLSQPSFQTATTLNTTQTLSTENDVLDVVNKYYLNEVPNTKKLQNFKNKGLIASLEDPYSEYITSEEQVKFIDGLNQRYKGIGIRIEKKDESFLVVEVIKGSPAEEKQVQKGDIIVKVGDSLITGSTQTKELVDKIKGPEGTTVKIQFFRAGKAIDIEIPRREIKSELIKLDIDGANAIITITSFGEDLDKKMQEITSKIVANKDIQKIIIDVRSNTGGLLGEVVEVLSYFVPDKTLLVKEKGRNTSPEFNQSLYAKPKSNSLQNYQIIVLTDKFSASASEILAGALRDQKGSKLVGEKTFGKGVVQKEFPLKNGDFVKITVAQWLTPKDGQIDKVGLEPDIKVSEKENALEVAKKL
jgi:carboxyl-terminal processing protease